MRKASVVLVIMAAVVALAASVCTVQKGLAGQSPGLYSPLQCREITYLHDQLAVYLKKTIDAGAFSGRAGLAESQGDKTAGMDSSGLPTLINNSPAAGTVFFFLADDDINMARRLFRPGE